MATEIDQAAVAPFNVALFAECKILDAAGSEVRVGQLWQKKTTMFIFLRHFACIACRAHATQIWQEREKFLKNGAQIVFVGNGSPHFINMFKEDLHLNEAAVYTDPSLASFRAAGFKRGFLATVGPRAAVNAVKLFVSGNVQTGYVKDAGDLWQLGGVVVVRPSGQVAYHFVSQALGDHPSESAVEF